MPHPPATIVVVPRERFSYARRSLESVYRNTVDPFELVYVDGNSPAPLAQYLRHEAARHGFRLERVERYLSPNQARNLGLTHVRTKYVVFLDNDVEVESGWLTHLLACAQTTGAWAVSPVYFEGKVSERIVHTAGGFVGFPEINGHRTPQVDHFFHSVPYKEARPKLRREPTGFCEFHCVLIAMDAFKRIGPLDEELLSLHEHLDLSLRIQQAGGAVFLEPDSHVTYVQGMLDKSDLDYAQLRWSDDWNRRSTYHFLRTWRVDKDSPWGASVIDFGRVHREHLQNMQRTPSRILKTVAKRLLPDQWRAKLQDARAGRTASGRPTA